MIHRYLALVAAIGIALCICAESSGYQGNTRPNMRSYTKPTDIKSETADGIVEMWRRGFCTKSMIYEPAKVMARRIVTAAKGKNLPILDSREFRKTNPIFCYAVSGEKLYAGTDSLIAVIDTAKRELVKTVGKADGLPDAQVVSLAADGDNLWIVTQKGTALLKADGKATIQGMPLCAAGRFLAAKEAVWLAADTGFYRYDRKTSAWKTLGEAPWAARISGIIQSGLWNDLRQSIVNSLFAEFVAAGDKLWFLSLGSLYAYDPAGDSWSTALSGAHKLAVAGGNLWALTPQTVVKFSGNEKSEFAAGKELPAGAPAAIAADENGDIWVAIQSEQDTASSTLKGGGIARFRSAEGKWELFTEINGAKIFLPTFMGKIGGDIVVAVQCADKTKTLLAHPGMAHITRILPDISALAVHRYDRTAGKWITTPMALDFSADRCIVGEWGTYQMAKVGPCSIERVAGDGGNVFAEYSVRAKDYYAGYYLTVGRFAGKEGAEWKASYVNGEKELSLAGEQPDLLMIARSHGDDVVRGEGQYDVLGLETIGGKVWTITEGAVACHDGGWKTVFRSPNRLYWVASATVADKENVWFGCDRELITRYRKATGTWEVVGRVKGRAITAMALKDGKLFVRSQKYTEGNLPPPLADISVVGDADILVFENNQWKSADQFPQADAAQGWTIDPSSAVLAKGGKERGAVPGVFQPAVLCEDAPDGVVWVKTYGGVVRVSVKE